MQSTELWCIVRFVQRKFSLKALTPLVILLTFFSATAFAQSSSASSQSAPSASSSAPASAQPKTPRPSLPPAFDPKTKTPLYQTIQEDWGSLEIGASKLEPETPIVGQVEEEETFTRSLVQVKWRPGDPIDLWIVLPKGVKKPCVVSREPPPRGHLTTSLASIRYNPILGEFFRCKYQYPDGTKGFYIAEQGKAPPPNYTPRSCRFALFLRSRLLPPAPAGDSRTPWFSH